MNISIKPAIILGISLLSLQSSFAQNNNEDNTLTLSAQIRPKSEFRNGAFTPLSSNQDPAALISQRTRLSANYQYKDDLSIQITPQFVNVWGQDPLSQGAANKNGFGLYEAWAKIKLGIGTYLQAGRQVISLDDERFYGESDWGQGGRSHDAISLHYDGEQGAFKAFGAFNQNYKELYNNNMYNPAGSLFSSKDAANYKWMQTLWGRYNFDKNMYISGIFSNLGFQNALDAMDSAKTYFNQTLGANFSSTVKNTKFDLSAYYQFGDNAQGKNTQAYLLAAKIENKINKNWSLAIGGDFLSGNDVGVTPSSDNEAFIPYFGTNHKFYGAMDYFYAGNGHKGTGLIDAYLKASYKHNNNWAWNFTLHNFATNNKIYTGIDYLGANLGQELDIDFAFAINKFTKLTGGYSVFLNTESLDYLKGVNNTNSTQHWAWLSLNVNPKIFSK